jgi:RecA-family ATPase
MTAKKRKSTRNSPIGIDEILDTEIREEPSILINGVLPAGGGMILGGESEVGKSLMRVEWSVLLACGLPIYGMRTPHAQTVLVFQTENIIKQEQFRTRKIMQGYGIESCHNRIHYARSYRKPYLLNDQFIKHSIHQIQTSGATVVWFDPLVSFHSERENDNVRMRNVLDSIKYLNNQTGAASIIIHHFGQPGKQGEEIPLRYRLRGASAIRDWADTLITLRMTSKAENPRPGRQLDYVKIRNGPQRPPLYLERDRDFVHRVTEDNRKASPMEVATVVSENQEEHGFCGSQNDLVRLVTENCECSRGTAMSAIKEAIRDGYIKKKVILWLFFSRWSKFH